jgi:hypothetical protein
MSEFASENVLKYTVEAFAETIALKVKQLRRFVPKERTLTNTDLTGAYIEEVVRGFVRSWIGHRQFVHGTFYSERQATSGQKPLQIDGIIYDPTHGPVTLREADFVVVHPAFCAGVVEIKMTFKSIKSFQERLREVHRRYLDHLGTPSVMGVVIADKDPIATSKCDWPGGGNITYYKYNMVPLCPIFVLFKETEEGEYEPFYPAIEAMIRAIHGNFQIYSRCI